MKYLLRFTLCLLLFLPGWKVRADDTNAAAKSDTAGETDYIILGAGCFWCTEAIYQQIPGVIFATPGYSGGTTMSPAYEEVCTGTTGHAEVCRVVSDPRKTSLEKILAVFWEMHDPTSLNWQGADTGAQYRSAIFYHTDEQRRIAEQSKSTAAKEFSKPIVTEITKAGPFYRAEAYHQDY